MPYSNVEFLIKSQDGFIVVDVYDLPYRLNRTAFSSSSDRLKSLGGTSSTKIKLSNSKRNKVVFLGKTDFKSFAKFNAYRDFEAIIKENGSEVSRGVFKLEAVLNDGFEGAFFDKDIDWVERLDKVRLNRLGYVNDKPTWLAAFNGAQTFDLVNDLDNRQTDFVAPTIIYNNTPILDYLDFTDSDIWGEFDAFDVRTKDGKRFPDDFKTVVGFPSVLRMGLKFDHFPPALYFRNVLERIFAEIGMSIDCTLFYEDWFNSLIMAYTGTGFLYNWKNIGSVYSTTPNVIQIGESDFDSTVTTKKAVPSTGLSINKLMLPETDSAPTRVWIAQEQFTFKFANIIKHDDIHDLVDKATLTNSFERSGAYLIPSDGKYRITASSQIHNILDNFSYYEPFSFYWYGGFLFNAFGGWDLESQVTTKPSVADRWFGWDDSVLIITRTDGNGNMSEQTKTMLFEWMNGFSKDFTTQKSDVIAYLSPKRWVLRDSGELINDVDVLGSPYSDFYSEVKVGDVSGFSNFVGHEVLSASEPLVSISHGKISVEVDLNKGDNVKIMWVSLCNIYGLVVRDAGVDDFFDHAANPNDVSHEFGNSAFDGTFSNADRAEYSIDYLCGEYDLDLAANLPSITAKQFVASFIKQFNLHFTANGSQISFYPAKQFYSKEVYDITSRVDVSKGWKSEPVDTPKNWVVGYDNDKNDRLLTDSKKSCSGVVDDFADYGNVSFDNENTYSENAVSDLNMFSATRFLRSAISINPFGFDLTTIPYEFPETCSPLDPTICFKKGLELGVIYANYEFEYEFPSIQSEASYKNKLFGNWSLDFNYSPRLLYHLGTANQYNQNISLPKNNWGSIIDMPRAEIDYCNLTKHWFRPTVSQFDGENSLMTGINYPTLRYDTADGLFNRLFENIVELFNLSERLTLNIALRAKDWNNLQGNKRVRFLDQVYRLMSIKDYDPVTRKLAIIELLKEV